MDLAFEEVYDSFSGRGCFGFIDGTRALHYFLYLGLKVYNFLRKSL